MTRHVVMFSGGVGSWAAAKRVAERHGTADLTLLFTDTKIEDRDLYRFLNMAARNVYQNAPMNLVRIAEGRTPWQVFRDNKMIGNTNADLCSRILKREVGDKWLAEHCNQADTTIYLGIDFTEAHRFDNGERGGAKHRYARLGWRSEAPLCDPPYINKRDMLTMARANALPVSRAYAQGFAHDNCFSADTEFMTNVGIRRLGEMVGKKVTVLGDGGKWTAATIQAFGVQNLMRVSIQRYGIGRDVFSTAAHRWFVRHGRSGRDEKTTTSLRKGDRLSSIYGKLQSNVRPSPLGIAQGIVFGDGCAPHNRVQNPPAHIVLCGEKNHELCKWFPGCPATEVPGIGIKITDLPRFWKKRPPLSESKSFLYGWLAGYFAADGSADSGGIELHSADKRNLEFAATAAARIGLGTGSIRDVHRLGYGSTATSIYTLPFIAKTLRDDFFLIASHLEFFSGHRKRNPALWEVVSVQPTNRVEEVFCAVVPDGHAFALAGNILTGNCGGFCIKAGQAHFATLLRERPEVYAVHEAEEADPIFGGHTILRDRIGGDTKPYSLRQLREHIQAAGQIDMFDIGGCGCFSGEG